MIKIEKHLSLFNFKYKKQPLKRIQLNKFKFEFTFRLENLKLFQIRLSQMY